LRINNELEDKVMKKTVSIILIVLVLSSIFTATAFASGGQPLGSCATGFELHPVDHIGDTMHMHIGLKADLNGDGFICMKNVTPDYCLIVDDFLPVR
jgi:hypothetical protein